MKKNIIAIILVCFSLSTAAQVRIAAQSGIGFLNEKGYKGYINNTFSLGWRFENKISWGLQFSTGLQTKITENTNYSYCDSSVNVGWGWKCLGFDSLVNTDISKTYHINTFSAYLLREVHSFDKLAVEMGVKMDLSFLKVQQKLLDGFLKNEIDKIEKAMGGGLKLIVRTSYKPYIAKSVNFFIEFSGGIFTSPQGGCTDGGCDNFLERSFNLQSGLQFGVAF